MYYDRQVILNRFTCLSTFYAVLSLKTHAEKYAWHLKSVTISLRFSNYKLINIIEFDASLTGVGILWFHRMENAEVCLGGDAVDLSRLHFNSDSSNQNSRIGLVKLGITAVDIEFRGDSVQIV